MNTKDAIIHGFIYVVTEWDEEGYVKLSELEQIK